MCMETVVFAYSSSELPVGVGGSVLKEFCSGGRCVAHQGECIMRLHIVNVCRLDMPVRRWMCTYPFDYILTTWWLVADMLHLTIGTDLTLLKVSVQAVDHHSSIR